MYKRPAWTQKTHPEESVVPTLSGREEGSVRMAVAAGKKTAEDLEKDKSRKKKGEARKEIMKMRLFKFFEGAWFF